MRRVVVIMVVLIAGTAAGIATSRLEFTRGERFLVSLENAAPVSQSEGSAIASGAAPRVVVLNGETFDFGQMMRWGTLSHKFVFANQGDAALTLTKGASSCKCTIANFEGDEVVLQPGETASIELEWTAKTNASTFHQTAEIRTTDPGREIVQLVINGYVMESLRTEPPEANFGNVLSSEPRELSVMVLDTRDEHFEITGHRFADAENSSLLDVSYQPVDVEEARAAFPYAKSGVKVTVRLKPGSPSGALDNAVYLKTNLEDAIEVEVPIIGHTISDITVIGGEKFVRDANLLIWDGVSAPQGIEEKLAIVIKGELRDEIEVKVKEVFPKETLRAELDEPRGSGKARVANLKLSVPPGAKPINCMGGPQNPLGYVVLETNHPSNSEIRLQVRFAVN
jgi:uncharacterized cupredoxin-like copper-binding protein